MSAEPLNVQTRLQALLVKDRVRLGVLPAADQALVLGWVWAALVDHGLATGCTEKAVNDALQAELAASAVFLDIDHVELRRWLVDAGWLARDGFGRQYQRVPLHHLAADAAALAQALLNLLGSTHPAAFAAAQRSAHAARRAARRQAWQAAGGTDAGAVRGR